MEDNSGNNNGMARGSKFRNFFSKNRKYFYFFIILVIFCIFVINYFYKRRIRESEDYFALWSLSGVRNSYLQDDTKFTGFYENDESGNSWIKGNASIDLVNDKVASSFSLIGYYPENFPENNITVTINDNESLTIDMIPGNFFFLDLKFENLLDTVHIDIKTEKTIIPKDEGWNSDTRELGAIISSWNLY